MARGKYPHIFVRGTAKTEAYTTRMRPREKSRLPPRSRHRHGIALQRQYEAAISDGKARREGISISVKGTQRGLYVQFQSDPGFDLTLKKLEDRKLKEKIELVAAKQVGDRQIGTVFVPDKSIKHFLSRFQQYMTEEKKSGKPRHKDLVESIGEIQLATLRSLWTDKENLYPAADEEITWEVWLRKDSGKEVKRLKQFAKQQDVRLGRAHLDLFPDRVVVLVTGTAEQLSVSIDVLGDIAEVRLAKETPSTFVDMTPKEQADWVKDLEERIVPADPDSPVVCILDTGVNRAHPLLEQSLPEEDTHTYDPDWRTDDHDGHGTEMAGLALLGDLVGPLVDEVGVDLEHALESVKILPRSGSNPPELWGKITEESASRVEVSRPDRRRVFSVAVSATDSRDEGRPSSWSAAIDAMASGVDAPGEEVRRLFAVCAGNRKREISREYLETCQNESVSDPGQAWNALTIGAFTGKAIIEPDDPDFSGWLPVAPPGELSPDSTTSCIWQREWPIKPDILMEGGNMAVVPGGSTLDHPECLSLLTTHRLPLVKSLVATGGTSASTALAARLAAIILARYPTAWPETIRALMVHSARWTKPMLDKVREAGKKGQLEFLLRCYGFGVPNMARALESAKNLLTLVAQERILPFDGDKTKDMHVHKLPWPDVALRRLGEVPVEMRVTLSYFVEPNPGRRGWKKRHRYSSHGLRFDVKTPTEDMTQFRKRLNKQALEEGERPTSGGDPKEWLLGPKLRSKGSIHTDIWKGVAADLADRAVIGVYPVSGWWKDRKEGKEARYSLVVSIETPEVDTDIYTPVKTAVEVATPVHF